MNVRDQDKHDHGDDVDDETRDQRTDGDGDDEGDKKGDNDRPRNRDKGDDKGKSEGDDTRDRNGSDDDADDDELSDAGKRWKGHARTWEKRHGSEKAAREKAEGERDELRAQVRKLAGLDENEGDDDPKTVAERAQAQAAEKDAELRAMRVERAAEKAGRKAGADVDALLDSRSFATAAAKLDPTDGDFADDLAELVEKSLTDNPRLRAEKSERPPKGSTDMTGGGETGKDKESDPDDIDNLVKKRRDRSA